MANYEQLQNDYPGLAAMFHALQDGLKAIETGDGHDDIWFTGAQIRSAAMGLGGWSPIVATGLRMVADAIDPPPMVEAMREVAETLASGRNCSGETEHIADCPYLHGRAKHVCDDTCPAKRPRCLCRNQPTPTGR